MKKSLDYIRLLLVIGCAFIGVQIPGFVGQYGKALQSHYQESLSSVSQFQDDADRYFQGDLDKLTAYYLNAEDPIFVEGGESIRAIIERHQLLATAIQAFRKSAFSPYLEISLNPIEDILQEVSDNYQYTVVLTQDALLFGVLCGLLLPLGAEGVLLALWLTAALRGRHGRPRKRQLKRR